MKTRIISGVVAVVLLIIVLILNKTFVYPLCIGLISVMAVLELFRADKCMKYSPSVISACICALATPLLRFFRLGGWSTLVTIAAVLLIFFDFIRYR